MNKQQSDQTTIGQGCVLEVSRRHVTLLSASGEMVNGTVSSRAIEITTGDEVEFQERGGRVFVTGVHDAKRCLFRSYRRIVKRMGANIDHLFIISAVGANLNPLVIDRMLIAARIESIPVSLVVNKADLGLEHTHFITSVYEKIGIPVIPCSAKIGDGIGALQQIVNQPTVRVGALCGVSGVGKSTILNRLVPGAKARIGELSARTGQGRQTTSQPRGFLYEGPAGERRVLIDFPGVQFFGLSHVTPEALLEGIDEFRILKNGCRFINCRHLQEPECAVLAALESGELAPWRYQSYIQILAEIDEAKPY